MSQAERTSIIEYLRAYLEREPSEIEIQLEWETRKEGFEEFLSAVFPVCVNPNFVRWLQ